MSARRRRKQEPLNSSGAEKPPGEPILRRYSEAILMALATAAGAIFLALLLRPSSFFNAVMHKESGAFYRQPEGRAQRLQTGRNDLQRQIYQTMSRGSALNSRSRLSDMLVTIAMSEHEEVDASSAMDAVRLDPHNDLTHLLSALVVVLADAPPSSAGSPSPELARGLFDKISMTLELSSPTGIATTFHMDVLANLQAVYRSHFSRRDVALMMAEIDAPYYVIQPLRQAAYWEGFPAMQRRLNAIAAALETSGQGREAAQCRAWFRRPMLELVEREPDTPMRLFCLDLVIKDLPEASSARKSLEQLRDDFVRHAAEAPADRTDLTGLRTAVAPSEYRATQALLIAAITLGLMGAGAMGAYFLALALSLVIRNQFESAPRGRSALLVHWLAALGVVFLGVYVCTGTAASRGPYSAHWTLQMIILSAWVGVGAAFAFAGFHDRPSGSPWVLRAAFILPMAPLVLYFLPPVWVVEYSRYMDRWMHPLWAGVLIASVGALTALLLNVRRLRAVRKSAAMVCATAACLALGALGVHTFADVRWQDAAVRGRIDEFAARLGAGWYERSVAPHKPELLGTMP